MTYKISELVSTIVEKYHTHSLETAFTVAISGIDAAGKGHISNLLEKELTAKGYRVALINTDPWQNPIAIRLQKKGAAENLYEHIFKWDEFFEQLIFPLKKNKNILLQTKGIRTDADIYYPLVYDYENIDILLIEGILLFKKKYISYYDNKIWIDCSFETGLKRALGRNAENRAEKELISDYETYYYAAQHLHFKRDNPMAVADIVFNNDPGSYCPATDKHDDVVEVISPEN
jgi:uridine kinase